MRGGKELGNLSLCLCVSLIHSILQRKRLESNIYFWKTKGSLLDSSMPIKWRLRYILIWVAPTGIVVWSGILDSYYIMSCLSYPSAKPLCCEKLLGKGSVVAKFESELLTNASRLVAAFTLALALRGPLFWGWVIGSRRLLAQTGLCLKAYPLSLLSE